jgi:polyferredoxin
VLVYGAVLLALCVALLVSLVVRTPLKVDVVRDRAALSRIVAGGMLENVYRLQIMNATERPQRYRISAAGLEGLVLASEAEVAVGPAESRWVAVRLQAPYGAAAPGSHPIHLDIRAVAGDETRVSEKSAFLVPR